MNKKIYILEPRSGLCNQLSCISIGIVLGHIYNRDIYFNKFQIDYKNENNLIEIDKIINIKHLNKFIKEDLKLKINIHENLNDIDIKQIENIKLIKDLKINEIRDIDMILKLEENMNTNILNIKNPISIHLKDEDYLLNEKIKSNIKFHHQFIENAKKIRNYFKLNHYCCVHIRMEDDAIQFMMSLLKNNDFTKINDIYRNIYLNEIKRLESLNMNIYICTSLGIYENYNNVFYQILKKEYNLIDKNDLLNLIEINGVTKGLKKRELYGIIDYIIAQDSSYFIGCDWSSFSITLKYNHMIKNKQNKLLSIWDLCKKTIND
jgi:hypothetical protein